VYRREFVRGFGAGTLGCSLVGASADEERPAVESSSAVDGRRQPWSTRTAGRNDGAAGSRPPVPTTDRPYRSGQEADGGFLDRNRQAIIGGAGVVALVALALLVYKIRSAEPTSPKDEAISYDREAILEEDDPRNLLERAITVANKPRSYAVLITVTLGTGIGLVLAGMLEAAVGFLFTTSLLVMQAFLKFGWPYVESFYEGEPTGDSPDSMRFEGFSTDFKIFLMLFVAIFVVVLGLVLVGEAI